MATIGKAAVLTGTAVSIDLLMSVIGLAPLSASPFGTAEGGSLFADNSDHTFFNSSLETITRDAVAHGRVNALDNGTDMTTQLLGSVDGNTDVVSYDANYTTYWNIQWDNQTGQGNIYGATKCVSTSGAGSGRCQKYEVRYDLPDIQAATVDTRNTVACHEIGHTVGLGHGAADSCMLASNATSTGYSQHDKDHINSKY